MRNYFGTSITTKADVRGCPSFVVDLTWAFYAIPGAVSLNDTNVTVATSTFGAVAHGLKTGMSVKLTTNGAAIPAPLVIGTTYYVIATGADTFKLAASRADAVAPAYTAIAVTDQGTPGKVITVTAQANAGTVIIERAIDPTSSTAKLKWKTIQTYNLVTDTSPQTYAKVDNPFSWIRVSWLPTSGALDSTTTAEIGGQSWVK